MVMSAAFRRLLLVLAAVVATVPLLEAARAKRVRPEPFQIAVPELPFPEFVSPSETPYTLTGGKSGRPAVGEAASFDVVIELAEESSLVERAPQARLPAAAFVRYPTSMLWSARTGEVLIRVAVDETGNVGSVQLLRASEPQFGAAVVKGLPRYRFSPATSDGMPVAFRGTYKVRFVLPEGD